MRGRLEQEITRTAPYDLVVRICRQRRVPDLARQTLLSFLAPAALLVRCTGTGRTYWSLLDGQGSHMLSLIRRSRETGLPRSTLEVVRAIHSSESGVFMGTTTGALLAHDWDVDSRLLPSSYVRLRAGVQAICQTASGLLVGLRDGSLWVTSTRLTDVARLQVPQGEATTNDHGHVTCALALPAPRQGQAAVGTQWGGILLVDPATGIVQRTRGNSPVGIVSAMAITPAAWEGATGRAGPLLHASCGSRISSISVVDMTVLLVTRAHDPVVVLFALPERGLAAGTAACPTGGVRIWKEHELGGMHHSPWSTLGWPLRAHGTDVAPTPRRNEDNTLRGTLLGGGTTHAGATLPRAIFASMDRGLVMITEGRGRLLHVWGADEEVDVALTAVPWAAQLA